MLCLIPCGLISKKAKISFKLWPLYLDNKFFSYSSCQKPDSLGSNVGIPIDKYFNRNRMLLFVPVTLIMWYTYSVIIMLG